MSLIPALYVRSNHDAELLPNGVRWSEQYKTDAGTYVYSVDHHTESLEIPTTIYKSSDATLGLVRGKRMLIVVKEVDGTTYATRVAGDEHARYRECPLCSFVDSVSVTSPEMYLEHAKRFEQLEAEGRFEVRWDDVAEKELFYSSDRHLVWIQCLDCLAEYQCDTAADRQTAGIHYTKLRHCFVEL